ATVRALAEALLAADAKNRINLNAAERRMVFVGDPEHAVFHGTVFHARRRTRAAGAAFRDDGEFFRLFLARERNAFGTRLVFQLVGDHPRRFRFGWRGHTADYTLIPSLWKALVDLCPETVPAIELFGGQQKYRHADLSN